MRGDVRGRHEVLEIPEPFCLRGLLAVAEFVEGFRRVLDEGDVVDDARTLGSMGNISRTKIRHLLLCARDDDFIL